MSMKTWKEEFYPVKPRKSMTKLQAIQHSLTKWEGLSYKNRKNHEIDLTLYGDLVENGYENRLGIDETTCALCVKYMANKEDLPEKTDVCLSCPLYKTLGKCCGAGEPDDPYTIWRDTFNPLPMIKALKKCLKENS